MGKKEEKTKENETSAAQQVMSRWVRNVSDQILSDPELSILKNGLNLAVTPRRIPVVKTITATETACRWLVRTLTHRARFIVSDLGERKKELEHVRP